MTDPYRCLRCTTIAIGFYNIIYCLAQFGILGWQVQAVKVLQWEYENRQLPATGSIDGFQARFPGLYAIYTETPERRRINAMYAIVLICLGLSIVHLMTTVSMLYGAIKRQSNWIVPWFFTCAPIVIMCTAYAVLWWSGDVFNEQLTMSVAEFVMSLAINGVCFIVVILYFLRITGRLTSDRPALSNNSFDGYGGGRAGSGRAGGGGGGGTRKIFPPRYRSDELPIIYPQQKIPPSQRKLQQKQSQTHRPNSAPTFGGTQTRSKSKFACAEPSGELPPWHERMPDQPPYSIGRKMRRRERSRERDPVAALRQDYKYDLPPPSAMKSLHNSATSARNTASVRRRQNVAPMTRSQSAQGGAAPPPTTPSPRSGGGGSFAPPSTAHSQYAQIQSVASRSPRGPISPGGAQSRIAASALSREGSRANFTTPDASLYSSPAKRLPAARPPHSASLMRRKSPQRVSFKSRPKVYERTPESSLSGGGRPREIHTVV